MGAYPQVLNPFRQAGFVFVALGSPPRPAPLPLPFPARPPPPSETRTQPSAWSSWCSPLWSSAFFAAAVCCTSSWAALHVLFLGTFPPFRPRSLSLNEGDASPLAPGLAWFETNIVAVTAWTPCVAHQALSVHLANPSRAVAPSSTNDNNFGRTLRQRLYTAPCSYNSDYGQN